MVQNSERLRSERSRQGGIKVKGLDVDAEQ